MNTTNLPGFAAERSLFGPTSQSAHEIDWNVATKSNVAPAFGGRPLRRAGSVFESLDQPRAVSAAAESVPGGPGNVPQGYGRDCNQVAVTVCAGNRCWTEYGWVCTYYPLRR